MLHITRRSESEVALTGIALSEAWIETCLLWSDRRGGGVELRQRLYFLACYCLKVVLTCVRRSDGVTHTGIGGLGRSRLLLPT
jgi:hypothetical protein